jgi:hypothetical protein
MPTLTIKIAPSGAPLTETLNDPSSDGLQHQAWCGSSGRDDGVGRITLSYGRKAADKG